MSTTVVSPSGPVLYAEVQSVQAKAELTLRRDGTMLVEVSAGCRQFVLGHDDLDWLFEQLCARRRAQTGAPGG